MNSLIILAAGSGERAQQEIPKQFIRLNNKKKLLFNQYAYIGQNESNFKFNEVITVVPKNWVEETKEDLISYKNNILNKVVPGGSTRTESSYIGLTHCSKQCKKVLIHDSARLFASKKLFNTCIKNLDKFDAVIPVIKSKDTIITKKAHSLEYLNRKFLRSIQTPQAFQYKLIMKAYNNIAIKKTDDLQILLKYNPNASIKFINGTDKNFKVTTDYDIQLLKELSKNKPFWISLYE